MFYHIYMKAFIALIAFSISAFAAAAAPSDKAARIGPPGALVVDVRTPEEHAAGRIPGSVLFPYDLIRPKAADFAALVGSGGKDRPIVVYCRSGRRSEIAVQELRRLGYKNITDYGAIGNWKGQLER